jgi:hypothetical protein
MSIGYLDEEVYMKNPQGLSLLKRIKGPFVGPEAIVNQGPYLDLIKLVGINEFNYLIIF